MTALENVMEGPVTVKGVSKETAKEKGELLLRKVGLADKAGYYPYQLSGGQRQLGWNCQGSCDGAKGHAF